jgi:hypothetical protein
MRGGCSGLATLLVLGLAFGGCVETAVILLASAPTPVAYDHGEGFDAPVLDGIAPRESPAFPHAYIVMPAHVAVEHAMVWIETNPADRHRSKQLDRRGVRQLTEKVFGKYQLVAALLEKRGLAQQVQVVQPGMRVIATTADLRVYVQLPATPPACPDLPSVPHDKRIVASTVVGVDGYALYTGSSSALVHENAATHDFRARMLDLLTRLDASAMQLQATQSPTTAVKAVKGRDQVHVQVAVKVDVTSTSKLR